MADFVGISLVERDLSISILPTAAVTAAYAGNFHWGPVNYPIQVTNESQLAGKFGTPTDSNYIDFYNVSRVFLYKSAGLSGSVLVSRATGAASLNSILEVTVAAVVPEANSTPIRVDNEDEVPTIVFGADDEVTPNNAVIQFLGRYPGTKGNEFQIAVANVADFGTANITTGLSFESEFDVAPTGTEIAVVVADASGNILEKRIVDMTPGNTDPTGLNNYIEDVFNERSEYIYAYVNTGETVLDPVSFELTSMTGGALDEPLTADLQTALAVFENQELWDINYVIANSELHSECITLCEGRQDCTTRLAAKLADVVGVSTATGVTNLVTYTTSTLNVATTYGSFAGNAALVYDKYAKKDRWIELAGDMVGLRIRQNLNNQVWFSDGGLNYGQLLDVKKLAINPDTNQRITLYKNKINPIISMRGKGIVKWGQRNFTQVPSALRSETTREIAVHIWRNGYAFLIYKLFEFNDEFTRNSIKTRLDAFLKTIQNERGVAAYKVVCDESNNPQQIINEGTLVVDIAILPQGVIETINFRLTIAADEVGVESI